MTSRNTMLAAAAAAVLILASPLASAAGGEPKASTNTGNSPPSVPPQPTGPSELPLNEIGQFCTTGSTDPDGDPIQYVWDWHDGTTWTVTVTKCASHAWTSVGRYCVDVYAQDTITPVPARSPCHYVDIVVGNAPPGVPSTPSGPSSRLVGQQGTYCTSAIDPESDAITYLFDWGDGNVDSVGPHPSGQQACAPHTWSVPGQFCVRARSQDAFHSLPSQPSGCRTVTVTQNQPPSVPATPGGPSSRFVGEQGTYCTSSTDPEADAITYLFDWGDGNVDSVGPHPSGQQACAPHTWGVPGQFCVRVRSQDAFHSLPSQPSGCRTVTVTQNQPPSVPATPSGPATRPEHHPGTYCTSSTDPESDAITYLFDWGDGSVPGSSGPHPSGQQACLAHTWTQDGSYCVRASAQDQWHGPGQSSPCLQVTVEPNLPPFAPATPTGSQAVLVGHVSAYCSSAIDGEGDQVRLVFDWGDGTPFSTTVFGASGEPACATHGWVAAGSYCVRAHAMDTFNMAPSGWSGCLTVVAAPTLPPNQGPAAPGAPSGPSTRTVLSAGSYCASSTDPDGDIVAYAFDWGDGTPGAAAAPSGQQACAQHAWTSTGTYCVRATARDARNAPSPASPCRMVAVVPNQAPATPPAPAGATSVAALQRASYCVPASDPEGDAVLLSFAWGDGTPHDSVVALSGQQACASHAWTEPGSYCVRAAATDAFNGGRPFGPCTQVQVAQANGAPGVPGAPTGPADRQVGQPGNYCAVSTDPEGDPLHLLLHYGNNAMQPVAGSSGQQACTTFAWDSPGTYCVKAAAGDALHPVGEWGPCLTVQVRPLNQAPSVAMTPIGPGTGSVGGGGPYCTVATDPEGDALRYTFDWGDGTVTATGLSNSGQTVCASPTWVRTGTFCVRAMASDALNPVRPWSACRMVTV
jgi:hypothetical protein